MVDKFLNKDISIVNELGLLVNPNFKKLFHVDTLPENEEIYVYRHNGIVCGFIHISKSYEIVDIINIVVSLDYRHKHFASTLLDYVVNLFKDRKDKMILEVDENNEYAIKLYKKFNFQKIGIRKKYYGTSDAIVMERMFK